MTGSVQQQFFGCASYDGYNDSCAECSQDQSNARPYIVEGHDAGKGWLSYNFAFDGAPVHVKNKTTDRPHHFYAVESASKKFGCVARIGEARRLGRLFPVAHGVDPLHNDTAAQLAACLPLCLRCDGSHAESSLRNADARQRCGCATCSVLPAGRCNSPSDQTSGLSAFAHSRHLNGHHQ